MGQVDIQILMSREKTSATWKEIESAMTEEISIAAMIADTKLQNRMVNIDNYWICILLKTWHETENYVD